MSEESLDKIGSLVDDLESLVAGFSIPMGADFHLEQLKQILPEKVEILKSVYISESGENLWG